VSVFVDTSGLLAILDAEDLYHEPAAACWTELIKRDEPLVSTSYVLVETFALVQRRLGLAAVKALDADIVPMLAIQWLDEAAHRDAVQAVLKASRRRLSLVDCASFETMRREGILQAFTFDRHFAEQGFEVLPERAEAT